MSKWLKLTLYKSKKAVAVLKEDITFIEVLVDDDGIEYTKLDLTGNRWVRASETIEEVLEMLKNEE